MSESNDKNAGDAADAFRKLQQAILREPPKGRYLNKQELHRMITSKVIKQENTIMVKPQELRIGNWVKHPYVEKYMKVKEISDGSISVGLTHVEDALTPEELIDIPLTPEILIACGFEKENKMGGTGGYCVFTKNILTYNTIHGWWIRGMQAEIQITSLHQLQNLYYALTGEELNYKP